MKKIVSHMKTDKTLVLCSCDHSIKYNSEAFKAGGFDDVITTDQLCGQDMDVAVAALTQRDQVVFACEQQARTFEQLTEELHAENALQASLDLIDLRDRAGWTGPDEKIKQVEAKQLALLADATLDRPGTKVREVASNGTCLIIANDASVLSFAETLGEELAVTCVLEQAPETIQPSAHYDLAVGHIQSISGGLSAFEVVFNQFSTLVATGRGASQFTTPRDAASSTCDIVIDLVSDESLLAAESTRNGYLREPAPDAIRLSTLGAQAKALVGTFEKPLYVKYEGSMCAHSRSRKTGCTRCIDTCGAKAIRSNGDGIYIDPDMCGGCGGCASVCPTGAIVYDDPPFEFLVKRLKTLVQTFMAHAEIPPRVLFIDRTFGRQLISDAARFSQGLPADVIPYEVDNVELIGHAELLATLAAGGSEALILKSPRTAKTAITNQSGLTHRLLSPTRVDPARVRILDVSDIESLESALYGTRMPAFKHDEVALLGGRREVAKRVIAAFLEHDGEQAISVALEAGDPYGAIEVDSDKCTLCLACVSQCPTGALNDRSDRPEINLVENACVQCGLCANTCPEQAITLKPQLSFGKQTLEQVSLHGEDPFECIECGRPFGVKSTIERIIEKLDGNHWMYTNSDNTKLVKMCDDCRINAQYHDENAPLRGPDRPRVRTTDDYLDS
ncbi:4Fe-4S binding protein [Litoricolaceae bacterium]|nr:4Fe-4S binding protein [Litorivicinaceae bacterium]